MRNLKKILALVLVLVMSMSFASAALTDADSIQYDEAVEVLYYAGVITGYEDGSFRPEGTLERDEAASIITKLALGGPVDAATADALENPFSDVSGWATDVIKWCAAEGIIDGIGDGKFDPNGKLTGYAFAKMLLVTIGYNGEYTGKNWTKNVLDDAKAAGLLKGLDIVLSANLTREQAAQMAFNAAGGNATTVITGYQVMGTPMVFASYYEAFVVAGGDASKVVTLTDTTDCLLKEVHGITPSTSTADEFGYHKAVEWVHTDAKGNVSVVYTEMATPVAVYTAATSAATIRTNLGLAKDADVSSVVTANGKVVAIYLKAGVEKVESIADFDIVEISYNAAKAVVAEDKLTGNVTYTVDSTSGVDYSDAYAAKYEVLDTVKLHGDIANGAWVTYTTDLNGLLHIYPTTSVVATMTGYSAANKTLTLDGAKKAVSAAAGATQVATYAAANVLGKEVGYSYDMFGYLVGLTPVETEVVIPTEFAYVYCIETQAYVEAGSVGMIGAGTEEQEAIAKAFVAFADGETDIIDLALTAVKNETTGKVTHYTYAKPAADGTVEAKATVGNIGKNDADYAVGYWFAYTENDGVYTLAPVTGSSDYAQVLTSSTTLLKNKTNVVAGKNTNSATYIKFFATSEYDYVTTDHTGLYGVDIELAANKTLVTYAPNSKVVTAIYAVDNVIPTKAPQVTYDYYLAVAPGDTVTGGVEWTFYVNGDIETLVINGGGIEANHVYTLTANTGLLAGTYSVHSNEVTSVAQVVTVADDTFFVAGDTHYYSSNGCEIYNITEGGYAADVVEVGDCVVVVNDAKGAALVYIVDEAAAPSIWSWVDGANTLELTDKVVYWTATYNATVFSDFTFEATTRNENGWNIRVWRVVGEVNPALPYAIYNAAGDEIGKANMAVNNQGIVPKGILYCWADGEYTMINTETGAVIATFSVETVAVEAEA